ncbi:MAG: AMP-binding protein [Thermincola sp.]|nr:AMP-binding protein [Thermincola sp.]MDT3704130.1 AMP-binding protein [Thermincola sp.]
MSNDTYQNGLEYMDNTDLEEIQSKKLVQQVAYVYENSSFYRDRMDAIGIGPNDIKSKKDLFKLPFITKEDVRESQAKQPPFGSHLTANIDDIIRVHASSGTTGVPSFMAVTRNDNQIWTNMVSRVLHTNGFNSKDRILFGLNIGLFVGGVPVVNGIQNIGAALIPVGTGSSQRMLELAKLLKPTALLCTPSYALYLAEIAEKELKIDLRSLGIRLIHTGGEPGGGIPGIRKAIEEKWGAKVVEALGNSDIAPVIWGECEYQDGMHFCGQEGIIPELIDPVTLEPLELRDGTEGELVYTVIDRQATPMLRFRSYDRVVVWTSPCRCGRKSLRLKCIGRTDDMMVFKGINVFPSAIQDLITGLKETTGALQIIVKEAGGHAVSDIKIQVEYKKEYPSEKLDHLKDTIEKLLQEKLFVKPRVVLEPEGTLPRFEMKAKLVRREQG